MTAALRGVVAFGLLLAVTGVLAASDIPRGSDKITICQACHGRDGNSPYNSQWEQLTSQDLIDQSEHARKFVSNPVWPKLAGQDAQYLAAQLIDFKLGRRRDPIMSKMAADLTEADIFDIAAYYANQKSRPEATDPQTSGYGRAKSCTKREVRWLGYRRVLVVTGPRRMVHPHYRVSPGNIRSICENSCGRSNRVSVRAA